MSNSQQGQNKPKLFGQVAIRYQAYALFLQNREELCRLGKALYPLSQTPPSRRDGGEGDRRVPHVPGCREKGLCFDAEPGAERHLVPL